MLQLMLFFKKIHVLDIQSINACVSSSFTSDSLRLSWTIAHKVFLSMEFSRQEQWSGLPFPSPGDLPNLGIEPGSPELQEYNYLGPNITLMLGKIEGRRRKGQQRMRWLVGQ